MKLIEALKQIKDLQRKAEDLRNKVAQHSAHMNFETPVYPDQKLRSEGAGQQDYGIRERTEHD